jgi:uncharacterized membrane protein YbaN (DUF454 family)
MKILLTTLGLISLALGVLGIFLPVLPTTPFLLLSAALFLKSSMTLYTWLVNHPVLGVYIKNYMESKIIPVRVKIMSISIMWITMLFTIIFAVNNVWLRILLLAVAVGITLHILSFKSRTD